MVTSRISCRNTSRREGGGGCCGSMLCLWELPGDQDEAHVGRGCLPATGSLVCPCKLFMMMYRPCCCCCCRLPTPICSQRAIPSRWRENGGDWVHSPAGRSDTQQIGARVGFNLILRRIRETILQLSNSAAAAGTKGTRRRNEFSLAACARHILLERSLAQPRQE